MARDIERYNDSMIRWPPGVSILGKILCLLGHHKWEPREAGPDKRHPGMKLRDQCGRCDCLK